MEGFEMIIEVSEERLPFFEALASEVRIKVIKRLAKGEFNIKELAEHLQLSSAIMSSHVRKLERAGIIITRTSKKRGKICTLLQYDYKLEMPKENFHHLNSYEIQIPVGQYTRAHAEPTCGLASEEKIIGIYDEPRCFFDVERINAKMLWFAQGYVEYTISNYIRENQALESIEIEAELSSEAPNTNDNWPSDITVSLNGHEVTTWTSPGDFGNKHGKYTPNWWISNQYGILKVFSISNTGVYLDGEKKSSLTLDDFEIEKEQWTIRFEVSPNHPNVGGLTIYGNEFGNYKQDILIRTNYRMLDHNDKLSNTENNSDNYVG
jgi:predicted transcriptional regulator